MDWQPLDFEKPIFELERRLQDLKNHSTSTMSILVRRLKNLRKSFVKRAVKFMDNLTAWQRVQIARHTQRPFALDYIRTLLYKLDGTAWRSPLC